MYQPISIPCSFKLLIYFILLSSQTFINWSVQSTFRFPLYSNSSRLILLRQISNDNFLKAPLKSTIFKYEHWASRIYLIAVVTHGTVNRVHVVDSTAVKLPWVLRYRGNSGHTCTIVLRENTLETTRLLFKRTSKFWTRLVVLKFLHLFLIFFFKTDFLPWC